MYLDSITITRSHNSLIAGDNFKCEDITMLVGDQGCGKSTLLDGLQHQRDFLAVGLTPKGFLGVETFYFDTEKMNPRVRDIQSYSNFDGTSKGIGVGAALSSRFMSHGETLVGFTADAIGKAKNAVLFLDEPEAALSLRNQYRLRDAIREAVKRKCQVILATHSIVLIESVDRVLSLEHRSWMDRDEFIATQAQPKCSPTKQSK